MLRRFCGNAAEGQCSCHSSLIMFSVYIVALRVGEATTRSRACVCLSFEQQPPSSCCASNNTQRPCPSIPPVAALVCLDAEYRSRHRLSQNFKMPVLTRYFKIGELRGGHCGERMYRKLQPTCRNAPQQFDVWLILPACSRYGTQDASTSVQVRLCAHWTV